MAHHVMLGVSLRGTITTNVARLSPYGRGYAPTKENKMEDNEYEVTFTFFVYGSDDEIAKRKIVDKLPYESNMPWVWKSTTLINQGESND